MHWPASLWNRHLYSKQPLRGPLVPHLRKITSGKGSRAQIHAFGSPYQQNHENAFLCVKVGDWDSAAPKVPFHRTLLCSLAAEMLFVLIQIHSPVWSPVFRCLCMSVILQKAKNAHGALVSRSSVIRSGLIKKETTKTNQPTKQTKNQKPKSLQKPKHLLWIQGTLVSSLLLYKKVYEKSLFHPAGETVITSASGYFQKFNVSWKTSSILQETAKQSLDRISAGGLLTYTEEKPDPLLFQWL